MFFNLLKDKKIFTWFVTILLEMKTKKKSSLRWWAAKFQVFLVAIVKGLKSTGLVCEIKQKRSYFTVQYFYIGRVINVISVIYCKMHFCVSQVCNHAM